MKYPRFLLATGVLAVALISMGVSGTQNQQTYQPATDVGHVDNETQALQVASVTDTRSGEGKHTFEMSVVNTSDKAIVEFTFFKKDGSALTTSGATTGWSLGPNESHLVTVKLDGGESVTLAALLFADGTGQGDTQEIARMRDYRNGVEEQYRRVAPTLSRAKNAAVDADANAVSALLHQEISSLSMPAVGGNISVGKAAGLRDAQQFIETQIDRPQSQSDGKTIRLEVLRGRASQALEHVEKSLTKFNESRARQ
jgi:Cu/Ag efflux protein CusF